MLFDEKINETYNLNISEASNFSVQDQKALRREFDELLTSISKPPDEDSGPTKEEVKRLKDAAFGPLTFWVIETRPIQVPVWKGDVRQVMSFYLILDLL